MIATVRGRNATLDQAIQEAARLLAASRAPVIAGLRTCIAGAEAAVALAAACGAVLDHASSGTLLRDLDAMRGGGLFSATMPLAHAIADTVLLAGDGLGDAMLAGPPGLSPETRRTRLRLEGDDLLPRLGILRALAAGRPVAPGADPDGALAHLAGQLEAARYGVAIWSDPALDALTIEMLCGLVADLNATTRWAAMPMPAPGHGAGVMQALAWRTGYPTRISFARGQREHDPEHDPWRFDAARLVASGEADLVLWIDAICGTPPPWPGPVQTIALTSGAPHDGAEIAIEIGQPGRDHDAVLFGAAAGQLVAVAASAPSALPTVPAVLASITEALPC